MSWECVVTVATYILKSEAEFYKQLNCVLKFIHNVYYTWSFSVADYGDADDDDDDDDDDDADDDDDGDGDDDGDDDDASCINWPRMMDWLGRRRWQMMATLAHTIVQRWHTQTWATSAILAHTNTTLKFETQCNSMLAHIWTHMAHICT